MPEVELVTGDNERDYAAFVERSAGALVQHTLEWRDVVAGAGQRDEPVYLLARDRRGEAVGAMPAFLFRREPASLLLSVPQAGGYGGVVVDPDSPTRDGVYAALLSRFVSESVRRGCALATVCTPPFFADIALYRTHLAPDFERENFFQYLDLEEDEVEGEGGAPSSRLRENIRRNIRRASRHGLTVTFEDTDERYEAWLGIYRRRMAQIGAQAIPRELFDGVRRRVVAGARRGFFAYVLEGEAVIAGGVFVGLGRVVDYFMASADPERMEKQPGSLLMYEAVRRARSLGFRLWNWQSSASRESPVYHYKAGWGAREGLHHYLTRQTGDVSELRRMPLAEVRELYRWHYVMPFEEFGGGNETGGVDE